MIVRQEVSDDDPEISQLVRQAFAAAACSDSTKTGLIHMPIMRQIGVL